MKHRIGLLTALALFCCLLPACAGAFRAMPTSVAPPDVFSPSDLVGTWYIHEIYIDSASASSVIQWAMVEIAGDGSATANVTTLNGTETHTFTVTINGAGEVSFDGVRKAVMSYDKTQIIGSELVETYAGLFIGERAGSSPDFSQTDCAGTWRMHSLQAGSGWKGWKVVDGSIDGSGNFTGTRTGSDGGSGAYTATVAIEPDGDMTISEPGNSLQGHAAMSAGHLMFGSVTGATGADQIGRFDIGVRTGGDFITADLAGTWYWQQVTADGYQCWGRCTVGPDGSFTGEINDADHSAIPQSGTMAVSSSGAITVTDSELGQIPGAGTLDLDRSFFVFTETVGTAKTMLLATKHPTEVASTVDVTRVSMDWGNGFSFDDPMDLDAEGLPCDLPGVWVDQSYFQAVPPPAPGSSVQAAYVYGQESGLQTPTFVPGKLTLGSGLSSSGERTRARFMPELAMDAMSWPDRTGDIELSATFDNFQGDLAPLVGNGFRGVDVGFSLTEGHDWLADAMMSFGFATLYVADGIGEIPAGYYNREPFISFGSYYSRSENSSVVPATGYDPEYPVELKIVITMGNLARFYAHFGPPEAEWSQLGELQLDWWPGADTPSGGCGTTDGSDVWYSPYVSSTIEYINTSGSRGPLGIATESLPDGTAGDPYDVALEAIGGEQPYNWQIVSGNLPPGISLSEDGDLSGTCSDTGIYTFTISVTDSSEPSASAEREYALQMNENMYAALTGQWVFNSIKVDRTVRSAETAYGAMIFDQSGNVSIYRFALDGTQTTLNLTYSIDPDGQISIGGKPWGALSFDSKRIVANKYDAQSGTLTICHRFEAGQSFSQYDAEGSWATHSFQVGPDWQGWRWVTEGEIDDLGEYTGTQLTSDGDSDSYSATVTVAHNGSLTFEEPDNTLMQRYGISKSGLGFGGIMGDMDDPGIGRFDVSVRTGGDFMTEDLEGKWWFYGIGTTGFIMRGWFLVDANGTYTGEFFDSFSETTEPISGRMTVTPEGEITIEANGEVLDGHFTLGMDRAFFAGASSDGDNRSMMVATKRIETITSHVDVTHVYMDWGNGFGFDDPLTLDTLGNPCGIPGMSVDDSYFTHPELPQGAGASALYGFRDSPDAAPAFEDGKLVFTCTMPPSGDPMTAGMSPQISLNNVPWEPQTSNAELRVTFGNLQGALTTMAGYGGVALDIGFRVTDGDNEVGTVWAQFAISTAYTKRGFSNIEKGYYNRQPFVVMGSDGDENWAFQVSPADGYDPEQPTELRIVVSPTGEASGYIRFGPQGEWIGIGDMQVSFWPAPGAWTDGCYEPSFPTGTLRYTPFITYRIENVELPGDPHIMPESLPSGMLGSDYEQQLYSDDGFPPFEWSVIDGELPPGIDLDGDGLISGALEEAGSYQFTVRVQDSQSPSASSERQYTIVVIEPMSIKDAKALPDGSSETPIALTDVVVTRKVDDGFYAEERDRSAGIFVRWADGFVAEGWTVNVEGWTITTDDGEKALQAYAVDRITETMPRAAVAGDVIRPIGMAIRSLGGRDFAVDPKVPTSGQAGVTDGIGLNNIGLLVKTWGRVTQIDSGKQYFYVEDGSAVRDGTQTDGADNEGVRVMQDPLGLRPGDYVTVLGISSCFRGPTGAIFRAIRAGEIQVHFPAGPEFVMGMPGHDGPDSCEIIFSSVLGASGYRLHQSSDGEIYAPVALEPMMQGSYGVFVLPVTRNTYFQVCALDGDGDEGAHSQAVYARVQDPAGSVSLTAPPYEQTDAPLNPSVCWESVPGAVRVGVEVYHEDGSHQTDWGAFFPTDEGCVAYGQAGKPITYASALDVLQPFAGYWAYVYAVDSGNWVFAGSQFSPFTTGDGTGGGGDIPPPPPPTPEMK